MLSTSTPPDRFGIDALPYSRIRDTSMSPKAVGLLPLDTFVYLDAPAEGRRNRLTRACGLNVFLLAFHSLAPFHSLDFSKFNIRILSHS